MTVTNHAAKQPHIFGMNYTTPRASSSSHLAVCLIFLGTLDEFQTLRISIESSGVGPMLKPSSLSIGAEETLRCRVTIGIFTTKEPEAAILVVMP